MLVKARPEAVTAFNSTAEHLGVVRACAPRKVHVMVEKPLAINFDQAKQIQQLASKNGIQVLTNYETTWYGSNTTVNELCSKPETFGAIRKVVIHDGHEGPIEIGVEQEFLEWLINPEKNGGGALMDFGCYGANQMTWLMKGQRPLSVSATTQQLKPHKYPRVEDEATIVVVYPQAQGIFQASWNWPFGRKDMEVYGEKGYIIADRNGSRIKTNANQPEETVKASPLPKPFNDPFTYLAAVVRGEVKVSPSDFSALENNMIVMEILDAATRSAKEKKVITLSP
jgi:predicted dehydrogenase